MNTYIGIDLGTSSVKLLLVDGEGTCLKSVSRSYPIYYPQSGMCEQSPEDWLWATEDALEELLSGVERESVKGISFGGQMHGLVILDEDDRVIRPAILWNDGRTAEQTDYLNFHIGKDVLLEETGNIAFAGFTAPKLLWVREHEPENFKRIKRILLPKDYLLYRMTGEHVTDYSDASGMLLLDVKRRQWSKRLCDACGVDPAWLGRLAESYEVVGTPLPRYRLPNAVVTAGAADNAAAAVGVGAIEDGACNLSVGTSGTLFVSTDSFVEETGGGVLHSFAHANGAFYGMGCILSAASANRWWVEEVLESSYDREEACAEALLGKNKVYFLPYLMGERCPYNDTAVRGAFFGLSADTGRREMSLAVPEGVAFALRDCLTLVRKTGVSVSRSTLCGGGAKSPLWRKILASVLNMTLLLPEVEEGPAYGACLLAMVGAGEYKTVKDACRVCVRIRETVEPCEALVKAYNDRYEVYRRLYPLARQLAQMKEG